MSDAERLFDRAIEFIETMPFADAQEKFLSDADCNEWAESCACSLAAVFDMAIWAVCELVPLEETDVE